MKHVKRYMETDPTQTMVDTVDIPQAQRSVIGVAGRYEQEPTPVTSVQSSSEVGEAPMAEDPVPAGSEATEEASPAESDKENGEAEAEPESVPAETDKEDDADDQPVLPAPNTVPSPQLDPANSLETPAENSKSEAEPVKSSTKKKSTSK